MTKYVAFIRGIGPGDPKKSNESLRGVCEELGFTNVQSLLSSGNVLFESDETNTDKLEARLEAAWPRLRGFAATTLVRSQAQLQKLVAADPFKGLTHSKGSYLLVTFFKNPTDIGFSLPYQPDDKPYKLLTLIDNTLFTVTDAEQLSTTDLMAWLEKQYTKELSSRTWLTINRILKKMGT